GFDGLFRRHPISATELWLEDNRYDSTRRLANSPWLERIRELTLVQSTLVMHGEPFREVVCSPRLTGLTSLELSGLRGGDNCLASRLSRPWVSKLRKLGLCNVSDAAGSRLVAEPALGQLSDLAFTCRDLTEKAVEALTAPAHAGRWKA